MAEALGVDSVEVDGRLGEEYTQAQRCCWKAKLPMPDILSPLTKDEVTRRLRSAGLRLSAWRSYDIKEEGEQQLAYRAQEAFKSVLNQAPCANGESVLFVTHGDIANRFFPEAEFCGGSSFHTLEECGYIAARYPRGRRLVEEDIIEKHRGGWMGW